MGDFLFDVLTSRDFVVVDQALFGTVDVFKAAYRESEYATHCVPALVFRGLEEARATVDLCVKKVWILTMMVVLPSVGQYVHANSDPARVSGFLAWLRDELMHVFNGGYFSHEKPREALVAAALERYASGCTPARIEQPVVPRTAKRQRLK